MRRRRPIRKQPSNLLRAAALFAVLCGAVAFASSFQTAGQPAADTSNDGDAVREQIARALGHLENATHALEADNYGRTRFHLQEGRQMLSAAINPH